MNSSFRTTAVLLTITTTFPAYAMNLTSTTMTEIGKGAPTNERSVLSVSERTRASLWDLSEMEWQRYQQLMQGVRGSISPDIISPVEVLGIHARDDVERQRYAERWAQTMHEDAERILAFQRAYDEAIRRLYPGESLIDVRRLPEQSEKTGSLEPGDRVLFFTRAECPVCDALLGRLLQRIDTIAGIDIYLTGEPGGDDETVRDWAKNHAIKPEWVRNRQMTLNHDAGALDQLTRGEGQVPYLMRRSGDDVLQLRASDL